MSGNIYVIKRSFSATLDGVSHIFRKGDTVREGHEAFEKYRDSLELIKPTYEHTPPPKKVEAPPPPPPPAKKVAAPAATPGVSTSGKGGGA